MGDGVAASVKREKRKKEMYEERRRGFKIW
jgi:hypothetical protein